MTQTEKQRRWMAAWRIAGPELERQRLRELAALTDERARRQTLELLAIPVTYRSARQQTAAGLVEQQRLFQHARTRSRPSRRR